MKPLTRSQKKELLKKGREKIKALQAKEAVIYEKILDKLRVDSYSTTSDAIFDYLHNGILKMKVVLQELT